MTIVIQKASGGVTVLRLVNNGDAATCLAQWQAVNPGEYVSHAEVAEEALPQDRSTRALWKLVDGAVVIDPALAPVPESISPRQFRQSLTHFGFRANIEAVVAQADQDTKDWYEYATDFQRNHAKTLSMAQAMGYTSQQMDQVWVYGAAL
jgi:hypothetical protein